MTHPSSRIGLASVSHSHSSRYFALLACLLVIITHYFIIWIMSRPLGCKLCEGRDCVFFAHFGDPSVFNGASFKGSQKYPVTGWMSGFEEEVGTGVEKESSRWREQFENWPCVSGPLSILRDFINVRNGKLRRIFYWMTRGLIGRNCGRYRSISNLSLVNSRKFYHPRFYLSFSWT